MPERENVIRLRELAADVAAGSDRAQAVALAELQRVSALALRDAVARARERGVSWRDLAADLGVAVTTLYGQFRSSRGVLVASPVAPAGVPGDGVESSSAEPVAVVPTLEPVAVASSIAPELPGVPAAGLDRFIGRDTDLVDLRRQLTRDRLVTLTGPPGVGKTRLAVELVDRVRGSYRDRIWWADLTPVTDPSAVRYAVAQAVGAREEPGREIWPALIEACRGRAALLVLDNCEHVLGGCTELATRLMSGCRQLRLLATSREALRIQAERLFPVGPLACADAGRPGVSSARNSPAVRLFADRARSVLPGFELTDPVLPAVEALCAQLDGLPLAIELAAGQVAILPPERMIARLDSRLTFLAGLARKASHRHQSLRAAIDWSYELLDKDEQAAFRRLAVLPGGFDEHAAAALCGDLGLTADKVWLLLVSMTAKSLLVPDTSQVAGRFRMLESLRAHGQDRLSACGEQAGTHHRLLAWLAELAEPMLTEPILNRSLRGVLSQEYHNLLLAVRIAEHSGDERLALLAAASGMACLPRGRIQEGSVLLERVLNADTDASPSRAAALYVAALIRDVHGDHAGARDRGEQALALATELAHTVLQIRSYGVLVPAYRCLGEPDNAIALKERQIEVLRAFGASTALPGAIGQLAWDLLATGRVTEASEAIEESLRLWELESQAGVPSSDWHTAGTVAFVRTDLSQAEHCFTMALSRCDVDIEAPPFALEGLALVAASRSAPERALRLLSAASAARTAAQIAADPWWDGLRAQAAAQARSQLSKASAHTATAEGAVLTLAEAVEYGLSNRLPDKHVRQRDSVLTPRERRVAEFVAEGLTNPQIAARMGISTRTVASHLVNIRTKLDLPTRAHITAWITGNAPTQPHSHRNASSRSP